MEKYSNWITDNGLNIPKNAQAKCVETCAMMKDAFPELEIKRGVVSSETNLDNYGKYRKEYCHCWMETKDGFIVDPTKSQFILLGNFDYTELKEMEHLMKCMGCGSYFDGYNNYCGKCKWSKENDNKTRKEIQPCLRDSV